MIASIEVEELLLELAHAAVQALSPHAGDALGVKSVALRVSHALVRDVPAHGRLGDVVLVAENFREFGAYHLRL